MTTTTLPAAIAAWLDGFERDTGGIRGVAEHLTADKWEIIAENDRVRLMVRYRALSHGRLLLTGSTLHVDGEQVPRAPSYRALLRLIQDPESDFATVPEPPAIADMVEAEPDDWPAGVKAKATLVRSKLPKGLGGTVRVLAAPGGWWALVATQPRVEFRINLRAAVMCHQRPLVKPEIVPYRPRMISLTIDGKDVEVRGGDIGSALGLIAQRTAVTPAPGQVDSHPKVTARGVQVRNQVVIRN